MVRLMAKSGYKRALRQAVSYPSFSGMEFLTPKRDNSRIVVIQALGRGIPNERNYQNEDQY